MIELVNMTSLLISLIAISAFSLVILILSITDVHAVYHEECLIGDLTGEWKGDDGGTYYVKQDGNRVWWIGASMYEEGAAFSNVFEGQKNEEYIYGNWADVPLGETRGNGEIELQCKYLNGQHVLSKIYSSGGFGGWNLVRPGTAHLNINLQISGVSDDEKRSLCVGTNLFLSPLRYKGAADPSCVSLTSISTVQFDVVAPGSVKYDFVNTERLITGGKSCLGLIQPEQVRNCVITIRYE